MELDDSSVLISLVFVFVLNGFLYSIYRWKKSDQLRHFLNELFSICQFQWRRKRRRPSTIESNELKYCYWILNKVSRSFAMVIEELPRSIGDVVCVFYLVLRGLDTVEDDMSLPKEEKKVLLKDFAHVLYSDRWSRDDLGENEFYRNLLKNFPRVTKTFRSFEEKYRRIIVETTEQMSAGMIEFIDKDYSIDNLNDYNSYCHYVAGLVGEGLSEIFVASQLEKPTLLVDQRLSNSMGLFLQKTNIIRDFHEDFVEGRIWWPRSIWSIYVDDLQQLIDDPSNDKSRQCLNHLIVDCLEHLHDVLNYLQQLKNAEIFQFCSIPQLMALATLDQLFDNPRVFTSKVKIRKGLTCQLILNSSSFPQILTSMRLFWQNIQKKISRNNNCFDRTAEEKFCRLNAAIEFLHQK